MSFFRIIQTSETGILQTFGKFTRTLGPGIRFKIPFIQNISKVSNKLKQDTFKVEIKTKDNCFTKISLAVQYKIEPENTEKAFFSLANPTEQIEAYIENVVRSRAPTMNLDELFESQNDICNQVSNSLHDRMTSYGFSIINTLVTEIDPSSDVKMAMNKINASERLKHAAKNEADANYITKVRDAEADRDRKKLQGEGISMQRLEILKGYEVGIDKMAVKLGLTSKDIIDFVMKTQHLDTLEQIGKSPNTKTLFLDHNAQGMPGNNTISDALRKSLLSVLLTANESNTNEKMKKI